MTNRFRLLTVVWLLLSGFHFYEKPERIPLFFAMQNEWQEASLEQEVFTILGADTLIDHSISLLSNQGGKPRLFFSDIETPVCADGECRLAKIKVYWNLIGNYVGYGIHNEDPLTKYEHDPFDHLDYEKLHQLLLDNNSILRRKEMSDLVDKVPVAEGIKSSQVNVDGISSATKKEIKEAVVKGGLYSCYTLWHLVHGEVKEKINSYLQPINSDSLNQYFLYSDYKDYQQYALKQLSKEAFGDHSKQIGKIFGESSPMTRTYILKKMPDSILAQHEVSELFYNMFPSVGINSRTQLINRLQSAGTGALNIVSNHLGLMTKNQLKAYLQFFDDNPEKLNELIESRLHQASTSQNLTYSYLIQRFLVDKK